jgi:cytochrome b involved in lipid metabolism
MKRVLLLGASLILLGAGCAGAEKTATPQPQVQNTVPSTPTTITTKIEPTNPEPSNPTPPSEQPVNTAPSFTMAMVAEGGSPTKCWSAVNGNVYDLTAYAPKHPGGKEQVYAICGKDGTQLFEGQHSMSQKAKDALEKLKIGILK